jgi:subtilisin family serine protease
LYRRILAVVGALALSIPATAAVAASPSPDNSPAARFETTPRGATGVNFVPASVAADGRVNVIVELSGDPTTVVQAKQGRKLTGAERAAIKGSLKKQQDAIVGAISAKGGKIVAQMQSAYNGIQISIPQKAVGAVAALPNVVAVYPARTYTLDNAVSVPFLGVPEVWQNTGYTGKNVKVGIIDTGIDYTHANFGGPGTVAAYDAAHANEAQPADPALFGPNAPRVKGGTDLVGDSYNADPNSATYQPTPHPDANPLDCQGHGSHVAGTAGGDGVNADGSTYTGAYDASTPTHDFRIGPGVAPQSDLYAIRVFGCEGSTDVVVPAIDWAVDHGMDVINMSLGSSFGGPGDADAVAASNAVGAGVVVVASAGNSGPNPYIVGSPSTGDGVISVAAVDSTATFPGAKVTVGGTDVSAINANGADLSGLPPMTVVRLKDDPTTPENEALGCSVAAYQKAGIVPGGNQLAVSTRGTCARVAKAIYAQQAGARAALMINNSTDYPPFEGEITSNPDTGEDYTVTIPFLGVRSTDAAAFTNGAPASVVAADVANPGFRGYASFSSGGPRNGDSGLGVDVAAPGVSIRSTAVGTGSDSEVLSGTSMAAPHVTGVAALAVQAHPDWSGNDVAQAVVSTADPSKVAGQKLTLGGVGLVNAAGVVATEVTASGDTYRTTDGKLSQTALNFGFQESAQGFKGTKTVQLTNHGDTPVTYTPKAEASTQSRAATVTFSVSSITVPAHGTAKFSVSLSASPSAVPTSMAGLFGFYEISGDVLLTSGSSALRVPYLLVPRSLSRVSAQVSGPWTTSTDSTKAITLRNPGAALTGQTDAYSWGLTDPQDVPSTAVDTGYDVRAVGVQSWDAGGGDRLLVFAVNTWKKWNNAAENEFDIALDTNGDGTADHIVFSADYGQVTSGTPDGRTGVFVYDIASKALGSTGFLASAPTDSSTLLMPVFASDLGLSSTAGTFRYGITGFSSITGAADEVGGTATYNPWSPALGFGNGGPAVAPGATQQLNVALNAQAFAAQKPLGVMTVVQDNAAGDSEALLTPVK